MTPEKDPKEGKVRWIEIRNLNPYVPPKKKK
jgi:hypothetical protein